MGDYNLTGLNSRDFEHLVQALAKKVIAAGVTPFGDGKDGAREASFRGRMEYPSKTSPWDGYLVIQCKFCKQPSHDTGKDGQWAIDNLKAELKKFTDGKRNLPKPEYYLFVTNVKLTAVQDSGSKDRTMAVLKEFAPQIGLKGHDVWSYDELCRFIDDNEQIRRSYAGFISTGDVLSEMMALLRTEKPDFCEVMGAFLQKELLHDDAAKLESAGEDVDRPVSLARVFVDLPATDNSEAANRPEDLPGLAARLLEAGSRVLRDTLQDSEAMQAGKGEQSALIPRGCVVVGGPGQGKSTLVQFLCQLYRAAILKDYAPERTDPRVRQAIELIKNQQEEHNSALPGIRRFPVRILLSQYAADLARNKNLTIFQYILNEINSLGNTDCGLADLKQWISTYPWLVVLDGLDEVPASSNRADVLEQLDDFRVDCANFNADVQIIATTRPQNYSDDFPASLYKHWYLTPLLPKQAMAYAQRLVRVRSGADEKRAESVLRRLNTACGVEATARLMQTPLQVTIMAVLVERIGEPPRERYRLFEQYYRTIYEREISREGPLSAVLSQRKTDIDIIHYRTGLVLQTESERVGSTGARLPDERFAGLVRARLGEVGVAGEEGSRLLRHISDGSLDRLVFLVRPVAGQIAFEIRSLQEFMAAEALLKDGDEVAVSRLRHVAPVAYWRNVLLFAVGKCFADHEHLLDRVCVICDELNDKVAGDIVQATLCGSRLALDILLEGIARANPKYERLLARKALELVGLPEVAIHERLCDVYHPGLEDLFQSAVNECLGQSRHWSLCAGWAMVVAMARRGVNWAERLISERWPDDCRLHKQVLFLNRESNLDSSSFKLFKGLLPYVNVVEFHELLSEHEREKKIGPEMPSWLEAGIRAVTEYRYDRDRVSACLSAPGGGDAVLSLGITSVSDGKDCKLIHILEGPFDERMWAPYISAARFAASPTPSTLTQELLWLSEKWNFDARRFLDYRFPWPLAACLNSIGTKKDLAALAERAGRGQLGSAAQWAAAELRWKQNGLKIETVAY